MGCDVEGVRRTSMASELVRERDPCMIKNIEAAFPDICLRPEKMAKKGSRRA
jgi:hypothetical protein